MKKKFTQLLKTIWLTLISIGVCVSQIAQAQSIPDIQWTQSGVSTAVTTDGNIIGTRFLDQGNSFPGIPSVQGDAIVKYSLQGNQIWSTGLLKGGYYLGGKIQGYDYEAIKVFLTAATADGGVAVMGRTSFRGASVATKINANGLPRPWQESDLFGYSGENLYEDLIGTPDGGFLLLVTSYQSNSATTVNLRKYDASGNFSWTKPVAYPTPNPATPDRSLTKGEAVINAPDGGYLIVGYYNTTGILISDANRSLLGNTGWVAKVDNEGNILWQKLLSSLPISTNFSGPLPNTVLDMLPVTDVTVSADGAGYALIGFGMPPYSGQMAPSPSTALLELNLDGSFKRARLVNSTSTKAFITTYNSAGGELSYIVGNTSLTNGADPQILRVSASNLNSNDPALFTVVAQRTFDSSSDSYLSQLERAGDGSVVFSDGHQVVKLQADIQPPFSMRAPSYNCQTGSIIFNVIGGDGSTITYTAPGVTRASATDNFGTVEAGLRNDPKVIVITATQSGKSVTYSFDLKAACSTNLPRLPVFNGPIPDQFLTVGQSFPGNSNFPLGSYFTDPNVCIQGNGNECLSGYVPNWAVEVSGLPSGMSVFTNNLLYPPNPEVLIGGTANTAGVYTVTVKVSTGAYRDFPIITSFKITVSATNPPPGNALALIAPDYNCSTGAITFKTTGGDGSTIEYQAPGITGWTTNPNQFVDKDSRTANDVQPFTLMARQNGNVVTYVWDLKAACGRARAGIEELGTGLQVHVLGNPVEGKNAEVEISGAAGKAVHLNLIDSRGSLLHQVTIKQAETLERVSIPTGNAQGILLLQVGTGTEQKKVKLLKP